MNYCNQCGEKVELTTPENDNRLRFVCSFCGFIHYQNPNIITGALPLIIDGDGIEKVLLCRRAIEPKHGYWTLPAGFMENEETLEEGATRESNEEANLTFDTLKLYTVMSLPHISQVYMIYIGQAKNTFSPGVESLETKLFTEDEIPWEELAFPIVEKTLKNYYTDRSKLALTKKSAGKDSIIETSHFPVHTSSMYR